MLQEDPPVIDHRFERSPAPQFRNHVSRPASSGGLQLSVTSDLASFEHEYRRFEEYADCTPFQTFDWLATWQRCIGAPAGVTPAIVKATQRNGDLLFILPLATERSAFTRRLVFLGRTLCDYNGPLLAPQFPAVVQKDEFPVWWRAICDLLQATPAYRHDLIYLDKMPERIGRQANPLLALSTMLNPSAAYRTRLGDAWDKFYAEKRSSDRRRKDRARRKKLAELGELRFVAPKDEAGTRAALTHLFAQKSKWFTEIGVPDLFERPGYVEFFHAVAAQANRLVHVSRLDIGADCVAVTFGLEFRGCFYQVIVSYSDEFKRLGPGTAQLHEVMGYAISQGFDQFDFTIGDEPFKLDWADETLDLYDHIAAAGGLGLVAMAQTSLTSRAKRYVKHSPLLRPLAAHLRSLANRTKTAMRRREVD